MRVENSEGSVHVYLNGRGLVVAPVRRDEAGEWREYQPVQRVSMALGYSITQRLTRALRKAQAQSGNGEPPGDLWDGDDGQWWRHHLLAFRVVTSVEGITLSNLGEDDRLAKWPADVSLYKVAQHILEQLKATLSQ